MGTFQEPASNRGRSRNEIVNHPSCSTHGDGWWAVKAPTAQRASKRYTTQASAVGAARRIVGNKGGGKVEVYRQDGRIREAITVPPLGKTSSVEEQNVERAFTASVWREGEWYVAQALEVDVASQGETVASALAGLGEALELHFEPPTPTVGPELYSIRVKVGAT